MNLEEWFFQMDRRTEKEGNVKIYNFYFKAKLGAMFSSISAVSTPWLSYINNVIYC